MKPIVSYYGGKQRLASKIIPYLPKHTVYVEPFVGGGAVLFAKPWPDVSNTHHYREVINDKHKLLINFYKCLQNGHRAELVRRIKHTLYSRSEHKKAQDTLKNPTNYSDVELAWAYFTNTSMSFSSTFNGGWSYGMYDRNHAATWMNRINRLLGFIDRMKSVYIENDDAIEIIKRWDSPQTLFYCDPPYSNIRQNYEHKYTTDQYRKLICTLNRCKGSFVLSGYNNFPVPPQNGRE